ncbi:hypothetical protein L7F22_024259 [Adiantum nelumboides]|nr:hypothetical protein [Adiantum nelumboides]
MAPAGINAKRVLSKPATHKRPGPSPIIKIVHVHAPKLVCTDVANFRALVQEMTGNLSSIHHHGKSHCTIAESNYTSKSTTDNAQGETSDHGTKQANRVGAPRPLQRGPPPRARYMKARAIQLMHPAISSSSACVREVKTDYRDTDNDDDADESSATSGDSTCTESVRVQASHEHSHFVSSSNSSPKSSVDGFFADLRDQQDNGGDDHDDNDDEGVDRQEATDRCGYNLNCSAYLPLAWRPAASHDIPGGFDYFSF